MFIPQADIEHKSVLKITKKRCNRFLRFQMFHVKQKNGVKTICSNVSRETFKKQK